MSYVYQTTEKIADTQFVKPMVTDIIDIFGKDVTFSDEDDTGVTVSVYANETATEQFAKSYAPDVIVPEPRDMADRLRQSMEE